MKNKKYTAGILAAALGIGIMAASPVAQAAPTQQPLDYINGATNAYSFRMKEDRVHEQNVHKIRFAFQCDGDQAKYDRAMKGSRSVTIRR